MVASSGIVVEVVNADNQSLFTTCVVPLETPFDWTSAPLRFRASPEPKPRHSSPIPQPSR